MQLSFRSDLGNSGALLRSWMVNPEGQPWRFLDGLSKMIPPRFMCFICGLLDPILVLIWFFWRVPRPPPKKKISRRLGRFSRVLEGFGWFFWQKNKAPRSIPFFVDAWFYLVHGSSGRRSRHTVRLGPKPIHVQPPPIMPSNSFCFWTDIVCFFRWSTRTKARAELTFLRGSQGHLGPFNDQGRSFSRRAWPWVFTRSLAVQGVMVLLSGFKCFNWNEKN